MSPPINKDWWLAAALTGAALPTAMGQTVATAERRQTAVVTTVTQGARGTSAPIYIENASGHKLSTGPNQTLHVLFSDQSALTVGPNSEVVIADYKFNTQTKEGNLLVEMTKGLLRVVGGFISKKSETVVRANTATVGIRGGISVVETDGQTVSGNFLFGEQMRMTGNAGDTQLVNRPGFGSTADSNGVRPPSRIPASQFSNQLQRLDGNRPNQQGGTSPGTFPTAGTGALPGRSFANDRLPNLADSNIGGGLSATLQALLGSGQSPNQS